MKTAKLTQLQYEVLESLNWSYDANLDELRDEVGKRRATLKQVQRTLQQLVVRGFAKARRNLTWAITNLGEAALAVVEAEIDLDECRAKFERKLARAAIKKSFPRRK